MKACTRQDIEQDALEVLQQIQGQWQVPAQVLRQAIPNQGWRLRQAPLPWGQLCACDFWKHQVLIAHDLKENLECPERYTEVLHWLLASQLGHIRLHALKVLQGRISPLLELQATEYAMAFLLPAPLLQGHPDIEFLCKTQPPPRERWKRLARVAEHFQVPTSCLEATLERHGWLTRRRPDQVA